MALRYSQLRLPSLAEPTIKISPFSSQQWEGRFLQVTKSYVNRRPCYLDSEYLISGNIQHTASRKMMIVSQGENGSFGSSSKKKVANLCVQRKERVPLPTYFSVTGRPKPLNEFLRHPKGMESMLNTNSLQSHECLGNGTFRCVLPKLEILSFEVSPIIDLSVIANEDGCVVELLSCKFQGSEVVESQNERFSASLRNQLSWDSRSLDDPRLEAHVQLNVSLEVYTLPFTLLPISAVETPGNTILQALLDRMVPLFLDHLLDDYYKWSQLEDEAEKMHSSQDANKEGKVLIGKLSSKSQPRSESDL